MFTIIIPTFNQEAFLKEAVDSALAQTVPCEVIVVNDGSTDSTRFILDEYEDKIKVIAQTNRGLPSARNTGIMHATGDWILPFDSDDILEPNCVEKLQEAIKVLEEVGEQVDVVSPSFKTFGLQEQNMILMMRPTIEDFKQANRVGYCSAIRTSVLKEVGGYSAKMVWGFEDYALWFDLLRKGKKIVTIPELLWRYRIRANSMVTVAQAHSQELMQQISNDQPGLFI